MSKIGNKLDRQLSALGSTKKIGEIWPTNNKVAGADVGPF